LKPEVEKDLKDSAYDFMRVVLPKIIDWMGGGEIIPIEQEVTERIYKIFDSLAGFDIIQIKDKEGIRGIASRVQWGWMDDFGCQNPTITIRKSRPSGIPTEYQKRKTAIESKAGLLFPYYQSQAYIAPPRRKGNLLYVCLVRTVDLYDYIAKFSKSIKTRTAKDGNVFYAIQISDLKQAGYHIDEYKNAGEIEKYKEWRKIYAYQKSF